MKLTKIKTIYNTFLERQANDAKDDINYVIENLIVEIHELESELDEKNK
jgi:hypothetical protein